MARIERRQARIRRIRARNFHVRKLDDLGAVTADSHYIMGKTENFPEHIGQFVQRNNNDPAIKVI